MTQIFITTTLRLPPEEMEALDKLVVRRITETGQRMSKNDLLRALIREATNAPS